MTAATQTTERRPPRKSDKQAQVQTKQETTSVVQEPVFDMSKIRAEMQTLSNELLQFLGFDRNCNKVKRSTPGIVHPTQTDRRVLENILSFNNALSKIGDKAYITITMISQRTSIGREQVKKSFDYLEEHNLLTRTSTGPNSTYTIDLTEMPEELPIVRAKPRGRQKGQTNKDQQ